MLLNKLRLVQKLKDFHTYLRNNDGKIGTKQRGIDMNLNNACNLRCKHCFTESPIGKHVKDFYLQKKLLKLQIKLMSLAFLSGIFKVENYY